MVVWSRFLIKTSHCPFGHKFLKRKTSDTSLWKTSLPKESSPCPWAFQSLQLSMGTYGPLTVSSCQADRPSTSSWSIEATSKQNEWTQLVSSIWPSQHLMQIRPGLTATAEMSVGMWCLSEWNRQPLCVPACPGWAPHTMLRRGKTHARTAGVHLHSTW